MIMIILMGVQGWTNIYIYIYRLKQMNMSTLTYSPNGSFCSKFSQLEPFFNYLDELDLRWELLLTIGFLASFLDYSVLLLKAIKHE